VCVCLCMCVSLIKSALSLLTTLFLLPHCSLATNLSHEPSHSLDLTLSHKLPRLIRLDQKHASLPRRSINYGPKSYITSMTDCFRDRRPTGRLRSPLPRQHSSGSQLINRTLDQDLSQGIKNASKNTHDNFLV